MNKNEKMNPYSTHQKFLEYYIKQTTGDILECGIGEGSTVFIMDLIKGTNRKLVSLENNKEWFDKIMNICPQNEQHEYILVNDWKEELQKLDKDKYSIVFIDQSPWEARVWTMDYFINTADYILIHDVDYFPKNRIFGNVITSNASERTSSTSKRTNNASKRTRNKISKEKDLIFDFSDKFKNWKVYYPDEPWPSVTGPPTLVGTNKEQFKLSEII